MRIDEYLRDGYVVIFCPRCQVVCEVTRRPLNGALYLNVSCGRCSMLLEVVEPPPGNAPALAK